MLSSKNKGTVIIIIITACGDMREKAKMRLRMTTWFPSETFRFRPTCLILVK